MNKVLQNNLSQIAQFPRIFSVIPFYFRFFRYKKYPRANRFENQISVISAISAGQKIIISGTKNIISGK